MQHAAGADAFLQDRIGHVQRAGYDPMPLTLRALPQIDQRDLGFAQEGERLGRGERPPAARDLLLRQADLHVGGHGDIHHLRVRQIQVVH